MADRLDKFHTALGVVEDLYDVSDLCDALHHKLASLDIYPDVTQEIRKSVTELREEVQYWINREIEERWDGSGEYDEERSQYNSKHSRGC